MAHPTKDWKNQPDHTTPMTAEELEALEERGYNYTDDQVNAVRSAGGANWKGVWSSGTTYAQGDGVQGSDGHNYVSVVGSNLNHNPVGDGGSHWSDLLPAEARALGPTGVKTGSYSAAAGDFVPVDISGGSVTVTLPTAPPDKTRLGVKVIKVSGTPGSTSCSINRGGSDVFNVASGSTSLTLSALFQGVLLEYKTSGSIWYVTTADTPLGVALGAAKLGTDNTVGGPSGSSPSPTIITKTTFPPGLAFYDVVGNSIPGGGGATNGIWNGYVDKLMFLLGSPRRKRDLSIGGAVSCLPSDQNQTGDGGFGHVLNHMPIPPTIGAGGPFLPQADLAVCHISLNDLALLGVAAPIPMQEAHRTIIARLVAAAVAQVTDSSLTFTGTWGGAAITAGQTSPVGTRTTITPTDKVTVAVPQISKDAGNRYVDWTVQVHPTDDFVIGVKIDGVSQTDVHIQGSTMCAAAGYNGAGAQNNAVTRRYLVDGSVTHSLEVSLKTLTTGGLRFDSAIIEADSADGPLVAVPNAHRCTSYTLWGGTWPHNADMTDGNVNTWNGYLQTVVAEFPHALYVDIDAALNKDQDFFLPSSTSDGAHPNDVGHGVIAKTIFDALLTSDKLLSRQFSRVSPLLNGPFWIPVGQSINSYPQFQNSWVNAGGAGAPASYHKDVLGRVHIKGFVKSGSAAGAVMFTLPVGYRPVETREFPAVAVGGTFVDLEVASSGNVKAAAGGNTASGTFLDGISFIAEA